MMMNIIIEYATQDKVGATITEVGFDDDREVLKSAPFPMLLSYIIYIDVDVDEDE